MSRKPATFRQKDLTRAIKAAKAGGLEIAKVEIEPITGKLTLLVKGSEAASSPNPFDTAPTHWSKSRNPFDKASVDWQTRPRRTNRSKRIAQLRKDYPHLTEAEAIAMLERIGEPKET